MKILQVLGITNGSHRLGDIWRLSRGRLSLAVLPWHGRLHRRPIGAPSAAMAETGEKGKTGQSCVVMKVLHFGAAPLFPVGESS